MPSVLLTVTNQQRSIHTWDRRGWHAVYMPACGCVVLGSKWHRESNKRKHCLGALPKDINLSGQIVEMWSPLGGKVSFLRLKFTFRVQEYFNFQTILFLLALSRVSNATKYCNISNKIKHLVEKRPNPSVIRMNLSSDELTGLKN